CTYGPRPLPSLAACAAEEKRREEKRREEKRREEKRREEKRREEKRREEKFFVGRMHINSKYLRLNY
ncbi:TPA: hypothetical protein ACFI0R_001432, partial [Neisseria gonorrhoeae]